MTLSNTHTRALHTARPEIVIVEDDPVQQILTLAHVNKFLNEKNLTALVSVRTFGNGQEALDYMTSFSNANRILITDAEMPVMDGFHFLQALQRHGAMPAAAGLYTTLPVATVKKKYENSGMDALYIPIIGDKPGAVKENSYPQGYTPVPDIASFLRGYAYAPLGLTRDTPPPSPKPSDPK
jgi:CheY-like chemotaxis protein